MEKLKKSDSSYMYFKGDYRIAGNFRGQKFSRFNGKSVWNNFCDFYFREFKWTDIWISVGINYCGFYFRDSIYSPRNRENKNPAKISRYTVGLRDHFVLRMSVRPCVCLSSNTFLVFTHSYVSQATHAFLGILPLFYLSFYTQQKF